jgi:uncharacterized membrane protein
MQEALDAGSRTTILVHYYRAMVGRADVWRVRMDTTANWAIGATAAIISFALGNETVPHYVVFIASLMTLSFLLLEARRLTFYHLWQQRVLLLERGLVRPALASLATTMPIAKAVARRLRRVYLYLFGVQLLAWLLKLANHPTPFPSLAVLVERADIGLLPGGVVVITAMLATLVAIAVAAARGGVDRRVN